MPGRVRTRKVSPEKNAEFEFRIMDILAHSENAMTLEDIKANDMILSPLSTQKLSRLLGKLIEMGLVRKGKSKSRNKMMYKAVSVMLNQGYEVGVDETIYS